MLVAKCSQSSAFWQHIPLEPLVKTLTDRIVNQSKLIWSRESAHKHHNGGENSLYNKPKIDDVTDKRPPHAKIFFEVPALGETKRRIRNTG